MPRKISVGIYCVYLLFDIEGQPFYVGCTKDIKRRKSEWYTLPIKYKAHVVIGEMLSKTTALALEALFISWLKCKRDGGCLLNKATFERKGSIRSEETRANMSLAAKTRRQPIVSTLTKQKMRIAQTGRKHSEATKLKMSSNWKPRDYRPSEATKAKTSASMKGRKASKETSEKMKAAWIERKLRKQRGIYNE